MILTIASIGAGLAAGLCFLNREPVRALRYAAAAAGLFCLGTIPLAELLCMLLALGLLVPLGRSLQAPGATRREWALLKGMACQAAARLFSRRP